MTSDGVSAEPLIRDPTFRDTDSAPLTLLPWATDSPHADHEEQIQGLTHKKLRHRLGFTVGSRPSTTAIWAFAHFNKRAHLVKQT